MLTRSTVRAMHVRLTLRRLYRLGRHRAQVSANPLMLVVRSTPPKSMTDAECDRYNR